MYTQSWLMTFVWKVIVNLVYKFPSNFPDLPNDKHLPATLSQRTELVVRRMFSSSGRSARHSSISKSVVLMFSQRHS